VGKQVAGGDGSPVVREIRKNAGQLVVVAELSIVHQQHDRHGGELLGTRRKTKVGFRIDALQGSQVADAVAFAEESSTVLLNQDSEARALVIREGGENRIELGGDSFASGRREAQGGQTNANEDRYGSANQLRLEGSETTEYRVSELDMSRGRRIPCERANGSSSPVGRYDEPAVYFERTASFRADRIA